MATSIEHYVRAQQLLDTAEDRRLMAEIYARRGRRKDQDRLMRLHASLVQEASAHATLALAAVTALGSLAIPADFDAWFRVASIAAPIPPEADEDEAVDVGSISPTDPAELGEWLRALPLRTILRDRDWSPCHRRRAVEHVHQAQNRLFDALFVLGDPFEITDGHEQLRDLAAFAPFTVLALGDPKASNGGGSDV